MIYRMKEVFPESNENYDIIEEKLKIIEFDCFLKNAKIIKEFQNSVNADIIKRKIEKKKYLEMIMDFPIMKKIK